MRSTKVQLNHRRAVNTEALTFRAGPALAQLAAGVFQSLSVCGVKWQHLGTLVIFLAAENSQAAVGDKSLANSLVVPRTFQKAVHRCHGAKMLQKLFFRTQSQLLQLGGTGFL